MHAEKPFPEGLPGILTGSLREVASMMIPKHFIAKGGQLEEFGYGSEVRASQPETHPTGG